MDPVIVVGAGPTGLALALCLARHDVPVVLLDDHDGPDPVAHPERTAVLRPATGDLLARIGYPAVRAEAARWTAWRTLRRRQEVQHERFDDSPGAPDAVASPLHLPQDLLVRGLTAALTGNRLVTVARGVRVDVVEQDAQGVSAHTRGGDLPDTWWRGSFLVGCDGPRSTVRKLLEVRFPGRTAVERFAVAAIRADLPEPDTAVLHRDPPGERGGETALRPLRHSVWRLDWSMRPHESQLTADTLVARIRGTLSALCSGAVPAYDLLGAAEYPVHQRLARRWRTGRAFLAGDAAHLLGALGTRAVEEGLLDAENLAWKLAVAWHQGATETLLDSYQAERRGAVGARLRAVDHALPHVRPGGRLRGLLSGPPGRHGSVLSDGHLGRGSLGGPPVLDRSPLALPAGRRGTVPTAPTGTAPGALVDDVTVIDTDGERGRLRERLGRGLLVLLVAPGTGVWESRHWLTAGLMPQLSAAVAALPTRADLLITEAYQGTTAHTVLLVRPDGHLVGAMTGCRPAELHACAEAALGGLPHPPADPQEDSASDAGVSSVGADERW